MKAGEVEGAENLAHTSSAWWHDRVFAMTMAVAAMAWCAALGLSVVKQPFLLHALAVPLAVSLYHPGHVPSLEGVEQLERIIGMLAYASALVGGLAVGYACLWRFLVRRLPKTGPSPRALSMASVSTIEYCWLTGIVALAVILRLNHITRGLTLDELTTTIKFVEVPLWTTVSTDLVFNNHLANSVLAQVAERLLGRSEWALRVPALLLGLTSLYALWAFTRRLAGPALAVLATAGLAFSPAHIFWSATARGYAGLLLFILISTWFYRQILHRPSWRTGLLFTTSNVLAVTFHLSAALAVASQFLFLLYLAVRELATGRSGRFLSEGSFRILYLAFPAIVGMSVTCFALILLQYATSFRQMGHGSFDLSFAPAIPALFSIGPVPSISLGQWMVVGVMCALCIIGWIACRQRLAPFADYFAWLVVPILVVMLARPGYLASRYFLYLLPFYLILVAGGMLKMWQAAPKPARVRRAVFRGCCLLAGGAMLGTWFMRVWIDFPYLRPGYREAAWALEGSAPETGLCAVGDNGSWLLRYYVKRDLFIPRNRNDFDQFVRRHPAITCADMTFIDDHVRADNRDILALLSQHGEASRHLDIDVYTLRTAP